MSLKNIPRHKAATAQNSTWKWKNWERRDKKGKKPIKAQRRHLGAVGGWAGKGAETVRAKLRERRGDRARQGICKRSMNSPPRLAVLFSRHILDCNREA